jgi:hypothetical protein
MNVIEQMHSDSPMAIEIRKLECRIWLQVLHHNLRVLLFTSALRGEGKSTTVAFLAAALAAHPGRMILAVDLDFRRPRLSTYFDVPARPGLAEVLRGECSLSEAITPTSLPGLHLMRPCADPQGGDPNLMTRHHLTRARELCLGMKANLLGIVVGNVQVAAPEYLDTNYHGYANQRTGSKG